MSDAGTNTGIREYIWSGIINDDAQLCAFLKLVHKDEAAHAHVKLTVDDIDDLVASLRATKAELLRLHAEKKD